MKEEPTGQQQPEAGSWELLRAKKDGIFNNYIAWIRIYNESGFADTIKIYGQSLEEADKLAELIASAPQLRAEVERLTELYKGACETVDSYSEMVATDSEKLKAQAEEIKRMKYQLDRIWAISTTWEPAEGMDEIRKTIKP